MRNPRPYRRDSGMLIQTRNYLIKKGDNAESSLYGQDELEHLKDIQDEYVSGWGI